MILIQKEKSPIGVLLLHVIIRLIIGYSDNASVNLFHIENNMCLCHIRWMLLELVLGQTTYSLWDDEVQMRYRILENKKNDQSITS